jgi:fermentation-respiration switch protein FrsA (DUF1100 family)
MMLRALVLLAVVYVLLLVLVWAVQRRLMYMPFGQVSSPAAAGLPQAEAVTFDTDDDLTLRGWFVAPTGTARGVTCVVFNGNAGHRGFRAPLASALAAEGIATLLFDYRGFGGNPGAPTEDGLARDARAARQYLSSRADVDATRLLYFGESLGTGVAIRLAVEYPPHGLVLRSPFTSMVDVAQHHYWYLPVRPLLRDRYESASLIRQVRSPLLVIAGARDSIVPLEQSRRLHDAAGEPKRLVVIEGADHNDLSLFAGPRLLGAITQFLDDIERVGRDRVPAAPRS